MTFYSVRKPDENRLIFAMNPLLRGILVFILLSLIVTFAVNMTGEDFRNASILGKINTFLFPLLIFLGAAYRYSIEFDKEASRCRIRRGLVFLNSCTDYTFDDLTGLNYRIYEYHLNDEGTRHNRGIPRRTRADFGFFFHGKLVQLEKNAPKRGVEVLYLSFTSYFPRELQSQ